MPNENTVLTALGLDTSQFQTDSSRATGAVGNMIGVFNALDSEIRKIPIAGDIYTITLGKIVDGFAEGREGGREFARIMRTDVTGSLEGTITQIDDTTNALGKLRNASLGRNLADFSKVLLGSVTFDKLGNTKAFAERRKQDQDLAMKRVDLEGAAVALYKQEAVARSEAYSKSLLSSENARIEMEYAQRRVAAEQEATRQGGPERDKWENTIVLKLKKELEIAQQVRDAEKQAAQQRSEGRKLENSAAVANSYFEVAGNARNLATQQLFFAEQNQKLVEKGTAEQKAQAQTAVDTARNRLAGSLADYSVAKQQMEIETEMADLQVRGQTRAVNQAAIRAQFETRIADELRRGNVELANGLKARQQSALLAEKIREYELGGGGRAAERQKERKAAQTARIVESQERAKADAARRNLLPEFQKTHLEKTGHLVLPKGLGGSVLDRRPGHVKTNAAATLSKQEQFANDVRALLQSIDGNLGG